MDMCLHKKRKAKTVEKGGGRRYTRQAGHVARPAAATWKVTASAKSVELPHDPINTPLRWKSEHTHHYLEIPLAKLSFLV
jgi:hypothetical protein